MKLTENLPKFHMKQNKSEKNNFLLSSSKEQFLQKYLNVNIYSWVINGSAPKW